MELIDVLNENGQPTGEIKTRAAVYREGRWHKTTHVWILNSHHELLIQRRAPKKEYHPNQWGTSSMAEHLAHGEGSLAAAIRGAKEEFGLTVNQADLEFLFTAQAIEVFKAGTFTVKHFNKRFNKKPPSL